MGKRAAIKAEPAAVPSSFHNQTVSPPRDVRDNQIAGEKRWVLRVEPA